MSAAVAAAAAAANANRRHSATAKKKTNYTPTNYNYISSSPVPFQNRYEINKIQDWTKFVRYIKNYQPPLSVRDCSGSHVVGYLNYIDQFGETKVHSISCEYYGKAYSSVACSCPRKESWNSLQGVVGRLRAAFEDYGGSPQTNPFVSDVVCSYLKAVQLSQAQARGQSLEGSK